MRSKLSYGCLGASWGLHLRLPRTRALVLGLLLAVAAWFPPPARAEMEIEVLADMEGGAESQRVGGRELEASMHSSLLQDFQEVTAGIRAMEEAVAVVTGGTAAAAASTATQQNTAATSAFPDSSAVVGRIFQMKVPNKMEDVYLGDIVKVSHRLITLQNKSGIKNGSSE